MHPISLADARHLDKHDPLRPQRDLFALPPGLIYLDGNSLGPLPHATARHLTHTVTEQWGIGLIRSWDQAGWMDAPSRIGAKIARLLGAAPTEVIVADSTTVTLFKLAAAALAANPGRPRVLTEAGNFPTDRHMLDGLVRLHPGLQIVTAPAEHLAAALDDQTALLLLCHVHYCSGARHDMEALTAAAHAHGALTLWDISHSAGAVPLDLTAAGADLAVGCGYKFLNGGPGAPAFAFAATSLHARLQTPIQGWIGHADPFAFSDIYAPAHGLRRLLSGTPPTLGLAALESAIDLFLTIDPTHLWTKSAALFTTFATLAATTCSHLTLLTPTNPTERGSHIAFRAPAAAAIIRALADRAIIADFRPPDVLRFGLTPLYTTHEDIWRTVDALRDISPA